MTIDRRIAALLLAVTISTMVAPFVAGSSSQAAASAATYALRINAGGGAYTDTQGLFWQADQFHSGGHRSSTSAAVAGSSAPVVYQSERWGASTYTLPVPAPGTYVVRVHLAEIYFTSPGQRVFNILVQGHVIASKVDVAAVVGADRVYVIQADATADSSNHVTVQFQSVKQFPKVSGIEVLSTGAPQSDPGAKTKHLVSTPVTPTTTPSSPLDGLWRPFAVSSPFNMSIPGSPAIDPNSVAMVSALLGAAPVANTGPDAIRIYNADASTPRYKVTCTEPWGTCPLSMVASVAVPNGAQPAAGADHAMVIVDSSTNQVYEFWRASWTGSSWQASWGAVESLSGDGVHGINGTAGATGSGLSNLGGAIRTVEIAQGLIPHAVVVSTSATCSGAFRAPAVGTDGSSTAPSCVPEGSRLQLDPSINVDTIPGITPAEKDIAHALQTYGAYVHDTGGASMAVCMEFPTGASNPYPAAGLTDPQWALMPHIPWASLRVLRSWSGT